MIGLGEALPFRENGSIRQPIAGFLPGIIRREIKHMSSVAAFPLSAEERAERERRAERPGERPAEDRASIEEQSLQAERWEALGRLAGGVVHDFNNLLTGVMLCCDLLLSTLDAEDRRRRYAEDIRAAIVQATGLVSQLLVFSRPQPAAAGPLNLNEVAASMRALLGRLIGENIVLELKLDPGLGLVKIDRAHAQQILLNLVLNSRDALPNGGKVTIETSNCRFEPFNSSIGGSIGGSATFEGTTFGETRLEGTAAPADSTAFPCVLLVVKDNGRGMSAETCRRLFEPFFTTKNAGKGTGLGLTTVRGIVTTNRGLVHIESEPERGTRAMILLPCVPSSLGSEAQVRPGPALKRASAYLRESDFQDSDFEDSDFQKSDRPTPSHPIKKETQI
jgi:two-component system, cell cycle sensor histidine kinase and response regulator CckA